MHDMTLSDMRTNLKGSNYPFPLNVAVDTGKSQSLKDRLWYEFSPYYIGTGQESGNWVDSMLCGSTFYDGQIKHRVPEYPLAHYMGIWGSAFAITKEDIAKSDTAGGFIAWGVSAISSSISSIYNTILRQESVPQACPDRIAVGQLPNFSYRLSDKNRYSRLIDNPFLCLVDGGITKEGKHRHNFATVPVLYRKPDILIMCDSPEHPDTDDVAEHLQAASKEAIDLGSPFPYIHRGSQHDDAIRRSNKEVSSLFVEDDRMLVVYMKGKTHPTYKDGSFNPDASKAKFTRTLNFNYTPDEFSLLSGLTEHIFKDPETTHNIKTAIDITIRRKRGLR